VDNWEYDFVGVIRTGPSGGQTLENWVQDFGVRVCPFLFRFRLDTPRIYAFSDTKRCTWLPGG